MSLIIARSVICFYSFGSNPMYQTTVLSGLWTWQKYGSPKIYLIFLTFKVMAYFDPLNASTFNFKSMINYAQFAVEPETEASSPSSESVQSFEFEPIFPCLSFEWSVPASPSVKDTQSTKEIPQNTLYIEFRVPSARRQYRVVAIDQEGFGVFFVNLDDIARVSPGLFHKITTPSQMKNGKLFAAGEIPVGVWEFEVLLRIICNSYEGSARTIALAKYMKRMLVLAARYGIPSLVEECKQIIMEANFSVLARSTVQNWFEVFESTKLDEIHDMSGNVISRTIRSYIISEMTRINRIRELARFIPAKYSDALRHRMSLGQIYFSPYEVDFFIRDFEIQSKSDVIPQYTLHYSEGKYHY